ncbi:MAG: septum site-determining protein MinC [Methylocella sp.]
MTAAVRPRHSIRFHSRSFHAMALAPQAPLADWLSELDAWLERSPGFFVGRPIVLDLSAVKLPQAEVLQLTKDLFSRDILVMGIEGGDPSWRELGMPPPFVSGGRYVNETARVTADAIANVMDAKEVKAPEPAPAQRSAALLLDSPLRSGQYIENLDGDVIVVGSVASGAEIVAGGSIHVYGALRGRAIAGAGQPRARIFCRKLEAELLAIDGLYMTADDMEAQLRGRSVQVWLNGDSLVITAQD